MFQVGFCHKGFNCFSPACKRKKGSTTVLAFTVLAALFIVGMAFHQNAYNAVLQTHHFKIQEQSLAMGDALSDIAKKIIEQRIRDMEEPFTSTLFARLEKQGKIGPLDIFHFSGGQLSGSMGEYGGALDLLRSADDDGGRPSEFEVKVQASITRDKNFENRGDFAQDGNEFKGTVHQVVEFKMLVRLYTDSGGQQPVWTKLQKLETRYEIKRVRVQPPAVRHFSLFAQDATGNQDDKPGNFMGVSPRTGHFNNFYVRASGERSGYGGSNVLLVNSGGSSSLRDALCDQDDCVKDGSGNPFQKNLGYILVGTGNNDDKKGVYLNLTAGNADTSETFHLFRGRRDEGDFYQLYTSDYASVLNFDDGSHNAEKGVKEQIESVKELLKKEHKEIDPVRGLAYYYMARKDYGYAEEWANHPEFGFITKTSSADPNDKPRLPANSLHLFGRQETGQSSDGSVGGNGFTVVFGNVFRRCLSLSGYKQVKSNVVPTGQRSFETQAGPIHFYSKFSDLFNHRLYIHEKAGTALRGDVAYSPIEVWDSRMNWVWGDKPADAIHGSWIFISGEAMMLRLIASIAALYTEDRGVLFDAAVGVPENLYNKVLLTADKNTGNPLISPLLQSIYSLDGKWPALFSTDGKRLVWADGIDEKYSSYLREILIQFYYNSWLACPSDSSGNPSCFQYGEEIQKAAVMWLKIAEMVNSNDEDSYYAFNPVEANWVKQSRVYASSSATWSKIDLNKDDKLSLYFTLPDPWQTYHKGYDSGPEQKSESYKKRSEADSEAVRSNRLNKAISHFESGSDSRGSEVLFENYFRPLMTDPSWILPYNYSLRFGLPAFRDMFFNDNPKARAKMKQSVIPELRDAVGFQEDKINEYMKAQKPEDKNKPLNNAFQKAIIKKYKDEGFKDRNKAYFFVPELGSASKSLEELELSALYDGRCIFKYNADEFKDKRCTSSNTCRVDSAICVNGSLELSVDKLQGPGILWVNGNFVSKAKGGKFDAKGVVIVAKSINFEQVGTEVTGVLVQHSKSNGFLFKNISKLDGSLITAKLAPLAIHSRISAELNYDAGFLKAANYTVGFQPYIKYWGMASD